MSLPDLIEIVPLEKPVRAEITVPGSKSITNRALILAALSAGESTMLGALWSEDTQVMVECLQKLGFKVDVQLDPKESSNRTITVRGQGGGVPPGGTEQQPLELFVGNAGTAARFLAALVCLGRGAYRLSGVPRMHQRPQAALFEALRQLGYRVEASNNKLPAIIHGAGPRPGKCRVSIAESSQFASALLLCSLKGQWQVEIEGEDAEEAPYVQMTEKLLATFPSQGGRFQIEPDASSGSYFWAAAQLVAEPAGSPGASLVNLAARLQATSTLAVAHWPSSGWQVDERFPSVLCRTDALWRGLERHRHAEVLGEAPKAYRGALGSPAISRQRDLGDSIMTAIVLAPFASEPVQFTELGRLRLQECERVVALRTELTKCGARVVEEGETLTVYPSQLHGAEVETYNDHRMAMCFAILGLKIPGIKLQNPSCVKKTFPNFFQKLAAVPPHGLGVVIRNGKDGRVLSADELFAE